MLQAVTRSRTARAFLHYFEDPTDDPLDGILTEDCAIHVAGPIGQSLPKGPAGARALNDAVSKFASSHWRFEDVIEGEARLVLRTVNESVHHGTWNGLEGNGRSVPFAVVWIFRFAGDRIAEIWRVADDMSRIRALGGKIVPA